MLDRNYADANFPTKHLIKDTDLFIAEAKSAGLNVSSIEGVRKILEIAINKAFSEDDYSSLFCDQSRAAMKKAEGDCLYVHSSHSLCQAAKPKKLSLTC